MAAEPADRVYCGLICHNVSKRHNIGTLVRSAAAFGVTEVRYPVHSLSSIASLAPDGASFSALLEVEACAAGVSHWFQTVQYLWQPWRSRVCIL